MSIGVHLDGTQTRVCGIDREGVISHTSVHQKDRQTDTSDWVDCPDRIASEVRAAVPSTVSSTVSSTPEGLYIVAPPGIYQIRRVPLEVAEEVDRRSQVTWEVQQALCAESDEYLIDYVARGSAAIWIAIPAACANSLAEALANHDIALTAISAEPIAIARALRRLQPAGWARALRVTPNWISTIDLHDGALVSATTHNTQHDPSSADKPGRDILQRHIGERSLPTYFVGDTGESQDPGVKQALDLALPLTNSSSGPDGTDTLMTIAYGAALAGANEAAL